VKNSLNEGGKYSVRLLVTPHTVRGADILGFVV